MRCSAAIRGWYRLWLASAVFTYVLGNALGAAAAVALRRKLGRDGGSAEDLLDEGMAKAREIAMQFPRLRTQLLTPPPITPHQPTTASSSGCRPSSTGWRSASKGPPPPKLTRPGDRQGLQVTGGAVGTYPNAIGVDLASGTAYVANLDNTVSVIPLSR
jgi:hypothetical protein